LENEKWNRERREENNEVPVKKNGRQDTKSRPGNRKEGSVQWGVFGWE